MAVFVTAYSLLKYKPIKRSGLVQKAINKLLESGRRN
jgi:hypothetical protein